MKKLFFLIFLFFLSFISINLNASSFKFVWENTLVEVPFGDSVEKYKDIPKAYLYVDGILKEDANITYNRDGDWLCYLRDVNTNVLKDYYVWYKAYENDIYRPGTCSDYKCKVHFKIVDNEPPKIKVLNEELSISSTVTDFDPLTNVLISDNCTKDLDITYSPKFNELGIGEHTIKVSAKDEKGNMSDASFKLNINDSKLPYFIKLKSDELIFDINSTPSLEGYYEAYDDVDGNITNKINYPSIKTDKEGEFEYELKVLDSSGNEQIEKIKVYIKDLTKPTIELNKETEILNYKTDFKTFNFYKYISNLTDNGKIDNDKLTYETNLENKVGTYYIRYKYNDGRNYIYKDLIVKLVSYERPIIETDSIKLQVGTYVDLKDYINVIDPSDDTVSSSLIIDDSNVNYNKEGSYIAKAYAINSSGISTEENIEVKVLSKSKYKKYINSESFDTNIYLVYILSGLIVITLIAFSVVIIILRKRKKI